MAFVSPLFQIFVECTKTANSKCINCGPGRYWDTALESCEWCSYCYDDQVMVQECSATENTRCKENSFGSGMLERTTVAGVTASPTSKSVYITTAPSVPMATTPSSKIHVTSNNVPLTTQPEEEHSIGTSAAFDSFQTTYTVMPETPQHESTTAEATTGMYDWHWAENDLQFAQFIQNGFRGWQSLHLHWWNE